MSFRAVPTRCCEKISTIDAGCLRFGLEVIRSIVGMRMFSKPVVLSPPLCRLRPGPSLPLPSQPCLQPRLPPSPRRRRRRLSYRRPTLPWNLRKPPRSRRTISRPQRQRRRELFLSNASVLNPVVAGPWRTSMVNEELPLPVSGAARSRSIKASYRVVIRQEVPLRKSALHLVESRRRHRARRSRATTG